MTSSRPLLSLAALLLAGSVAGCDAESPDAAAIDYRAVGHVDLHALTAAPWLAGAMKDGKLEIDGKLGPCADVLRQADAVTFGAKEDAFEVYVEGSFDAAAANACSDHIDAEVASHPKPRDGHPKPEAVLVAEGVFAVFGGGLTPSRDRLEGLMAADPSSGEPLWVTASMTGKDSPVERMKAWANPSKGMRAHAEVVFADQQKATEIYGKATLGLAAMSMSDEVGELASAVALGSSGKTMTAEVKLTSDQMKTLVAKGKARHEAHAQWHTGEGHGGSGVKLEIGTSE